jgi:hypothetical protein
MATTLEFPTDRVHYTWDVGTGPVLTISSGDTVVHETREVSDGQITPESTAKVIATLDWDRVYPLSGPVRVEGAEPGDTLAIEDRGHGDARLGLCHDHPRLRPPAGRLPGPLHPRLRPFGRRVRIPARRHRDPD